MKTRTLIFVLLGLMFSANTFAQKFREYSNEEYGFTISYPNHWKKINQRKKSAAKFVASIAESGFVSASVVLMIGENKNYVLDTVFFHHMKAAHISGDKVLDASESIINNQKFYWFTSLIDNNLEYIKSITYTALTDDKVIKIQFRANKATRYPEYEATFLKIINSFKIN